MVELEREGALARLFLARPEKANALDTRLLAALSAAIGQVAGDATVRVLVLGGRGRSFCGGADVNELEALDAPRAAAFVQRIHEVCAALRRLPVPVLARLHGAVIGAGLEIAAACDLRLAAEGTRFAMPEVRLGIPSVVEAALLPRLIGSGRAAWLVLTGEPLEARRALAWGLVEEVCADLDRGVESVVRALLAADPQALAQQKSLLQLWEEAPLADSIARSVELFREAYLRRRP